MGDNLGDEFLFCIVTLDRDFSSQIPYQGVKIDEWNRVGKALVFCASPCKQKLLSLACLIRETSHEIIYLNSFLFHLHSEASGGTPIGARTNATMHNCAEG